MTWESWDTAIVATAAVVAMSCTLPGVWLVLRRSSMMGDALSHTALPGIVLAFLLLGFLRSQNWISPATQQNLEPVLLLGGAIVIGILTAWLAEWVERLGNVEGNAALGVVFTSLFALGLLLIRLRADDLHLDVDCVLFGQIEHVVWDTVPVFGWNVPKACLTNGALFLVNLLLLGLFFKELRISTFDPYLATSLGISARWLHHALMAVSATTVVMAFESVGSILVVALLIVPAACGLLLCERLGPLIGTSLLFAAGSAVVGHVLAKTVPAWLFSRLGFEEVRDASSAGMIAVACGLMFLLVFLFAPRNGLLGRGLSLFRLQRRMASDDILATLYRFQERQPAEQFSASRVRSEVTGLGPIGWKWTLWRLEQKGLVASTSAGELRLSEKGTQRAAMLVRSHRLWESYMERHFDLPADHLHETAHRVEHYLDGELRSQLADELDSPDRDPHGREIPEPPATGEHDGESPARPS